MGARYLTDLAGRLRAAGCTVVELDGWQTRARSSGGYDGAGPWAVFWHHTASSGDGAADAHYCTFGSADAPVCNVVVGRDGVVYVCAAGATNTNGKGGPHLLPGGRTIPLDGANSRVFGMELSSDGVGMTYPAAQMTAAFAVSLTVAGYGIRPDDVVTHQVWAPTRKIDPATATAVQGGWSPRSVTSSGTWSLPDLRAELNARAGAPAPTPDPGDDDMALFLIESPAGGWYVTDGLTARKAIQPGGIDFALDGIDKGLWRGAGRAPIQLDVAGWQAYIDTLPMIGPG